MSLFGQRLQMIKTHQTADCIPRNVINMRYEVQISLFK